MVGLMGTPDYRFLTCNKSESVFQLFEKAIHKYGVPDRIRIDKGGKNNYEGIIGGGIHS